MLADHDPMTTLAVADLDRATQFYEGVLGFPREGTPAEGVVYRAGAGSFLVYPSAYAGTNRATALSFAVPAGEFDAEVAALRSAGVVFQTFEAEGLTWDDGVGSWGGGRGVWFADPDGNILNVDTMA